MQKNANALREMNSTDQLHSKACNSVLVPLTESDKHRLLVEWNDTGSSYSTALCIHQLFEYRAESQPDAIALVFGDQQLSYQELNRKSNQLAYHLMEEGLKPDGLIGLCLERSFDMVVAMLAVLKAGCAYVPLDPDYPKARLNFMLNDTSPNIVLTQERHRDKVKDAEGVIICLDSSNSISLLKQHSTENPCAKNLGLSPLNLAYVIYTSGSTGAPKGVMIEHGSLVNRIEWMYRQYGCDSSDVVLHKTPFSFDVSVWEIFLPLTSGAIIVLARPGGHKDPIYLSNIINEKCVTKVHFIPTMFNVVLSSTRLSECKTLRQVFCSGESLLPNHVEEFYRQGISAELHNLYGPTEASIDVSYWKCSEEDAKRSNVPIGRPIANTQFYILDQHLNIVPPGGIGDLYIGGVGLARGYLNQRELTAERFIPNLYSGDPKARLYKTGDLCRYLSDGNIEFMGRSDHQIKIRGFRVELGEIESVLLKHPTIRDAVVLSKEFNEAESRLVAYIVANEDIEIGELRGYLEQHLPDYMLPSTFLILPELPLTPSGKVDGKVLLTMELNRSGESPVEMSLLQNEVHRIWRQVLEHEDFSVEDDLFKVGGDSLAAVQIFLAINSEFGINMYTEELFSTDTFSVQWLAALIEKHQIASIGETEYHELLNEIEGLSEEEVAKLLLD